MKVKTNETKEFKPFDITITIESIDELKVLWHKLKSCIDIEDGDVIINPDGNSTARYSNFNIEVDAYQLWDLIDEKLNQL